MLNSFFSKIIKNLEIPRHNQVDLICQNTKDPVIKVIIKYRNHPTITAIKERCTNSKFSFVDFIFTNLNDSIVQSAFPSLLKLANITLVHIKDLKTSKHHYRSVSILPNISKMYERLIFKQMSKYQNFSAVLGKVLTPNKIFCQCLENGNW